MNGLASFGDLLVQKSGIGVVDDTLQVFAESGKFIGIQAVEHAQGRFGLLLDGAHEGSSATCRIDVSDRCRRATCRSGPGRLEFGMQQQDVELMELIDYDLPLVGHGGFLSIWTRCLICKVYLENQETQPVAAMS